MPFPARRAVVYVRVSSNEQEKEGFSIPAQLKLLRDYALAEGIRVVEEYVDVETAKQAGRSSFGEMVDYLHQHPEARIILVEKTDRLYRNLKDWVTLDELELEIHLRQGGRRRRPAHRLPGHRGRRSANPAGLSTGPLEGTNNKIKTLQKMAYGFRDRGFLKLKIKGLHETKYALVG